jgi:hypothetical protein
MNRIILKSKISRDGILHLDVPIGADAADKEVQVTVEPVAPVSMTEEEWRQWVLSTAGKWQGEFERPEQGEYEKREPLS